VYTQIRCTDALSVHLMGWTRYFGVQEAIRAHGDYHSNARDVQSRLRRQ
jgi:hypothetical protein